jgi:hypothetical protein
MKDFSPNHLTQQTLSGNITQLPKQFCRRQCIPGSTVTILDVYPNFLAQITQTVTLITGHKLPAASYGT